MRPRDLEGRLARLERLCPVPPHPLADPGAALAMHLDTPWGPPPPRNPDGSPVTARQALDAIEGVRGPSAALARLLYACLLDEDGDEPGPDPAW